MGKKIIIKIGSGVLLTKRLKFDHFRIRQLAMQVKVLQGKGYKIVLVVSGAVAYGSRFITISDKDSNKRQAAAGIGQIYLMIEFAEAFGKQGLKIAQILLTKDPFGSYEEDIKTLLNFYLAQGIIPVVNENDVLDLNSFGGNDLLAGEIAKLLQTEEVVILSTMRGSIHGVGGGATKDAVSKMLKKRNIRTTIVNGKAKDILLTI